MINRKTHQHTTAQRRRAQRSGWTIDAARQPRVNTRKAITNELRDLAGHAIVTERVAELDVRVPILSVDAVRELLETEIPVSIKVTVSSLSMWEHVQILFGWLSGIHWYSDLEH